MPLPKTTNETTPEAPYIPGSPAEKLEWVRIEDDQARDRVYVYPSGDTLKILNVEWIAITADNTHRLRTMDGRCVYILPGWRAIEWVGHFQF